MRLSSQTAVPSHGSPARARGQAAYLGSISAGSPHCIRRGVVANQRDRHIDAPPAQAAAVRVPHVVALRVGRERGAREGIGSRERWRVTYRSREKHASGREHQACWHIPQPPHAGDDVPGVYTKRSGVPCAGMEVCLGPCALSVHVHR